MSLNFQEVIFLIIPIGVKFDKKKTNSRLLQNISKLNVVEIPKLNLKENEEIKESGVNERLRANINQSLQKVYNEEEEKKLRNKISRNSI